MKILILTQWYPPEPQKLLSDLTQTLVNLGHEVQVLTGFPNYPNGQLYPGYRIRPWQREILDGVSVIRVPLYPDHSRSGLKRIINYVSFALSSTILGPWLVRKPEAIFVLHPPLTIALPAWLMSRFWRVPFTYNIQDMWPETLADTGMFNHPFLLKVVWHIAMWVYRAATSVIVISLGFRQNLINKGVLAAKIYTVSNWVDTEHYQPTIPDVNLAETYGLQSKFNVMFAGVVGRAQGLDTILKAAVLLRDLPQIQFVVVGDGVDLPNLRAMALTMNLDNVLFLGRHPEQCMPSLFGLADVLLVHLKNTALFRITIPHKILAYMASGKPVLGAVTGDAAEVILTAQAGLVCPPDDPKALSVTVREFYSMPVAKRQMMGNRGREAACLLYSRDHLVGEVVRILAASTDRITLV